MGGGVRAYCQDLLYKASARLATDALQALAHGHGYGLGHALPRQVGKLTRQPVCFWILYIQAHSSTLPPII
jgi:hypothetical protein